MTEISKDDEYKLLKQKPTIVKAANLLALIWGLGVIVPAVWFYCSNTNAIKEYAVVKGVAEANGFLTRQYDSFSKNALEKIDISKYTKEIDIPKIKTDKIEEVSQKTKKVTSKLSKLGIKEVDKVTDTADALQKQVDKVNKQLADATEQVKETLNKKVKEGLKKEVETLASGQIKKQLALSDGAYDGLAQNKFSLTGAGAETTKKIYAELKNNKKGVFKDVIDVIEKYAFVLFIVLGVAGLVLLPLPPFVVVKIAKKLASTYTQCPYCKKVYITKGNAVNILKMLKFW